MISKTYMASKSAHRLLATYNSSTDFRFCPLHSAIIFSRSSIDFSSAAILASLGGKEKKRGFQNFYNGLSRGQDERPWERGCPVATAIHLLHSFCSNTPTVTYFLFPPHYPYSYMVSFAFCQLHVFQPPTTICFGGSEI